MCSPKKKYDEDSLKSDGQQFHQYQQKRCKHFNCPISSRHDTTKILLKVALNTIKQTIQYHARYDY